MNLHKQRMHSYPRFYTSVEPLVLLLVEYRALFIVEWCRQITSLWHQLHTTLPRLPNCCTVDQFALVKSLPHMGFFLPHGVGRHPQHHIHCADVLSTSIIAICTFCGEYQKNPPFCTKQPPVVAQNVPKNPQLKYTQKKNPKCARKPPQGGDLVHFGGSCGGGFGPFRRVFWYLAGVFLVHFGGFFVTIWGVFGTFRGVLWYILGGGG